MQPMLNIALRAARSASELIFRSIERLDTIKVDEKDAKDYVSEVDRAAEQKIIDALRKAYPNHSIMGEETGLHAGTGIEGEEYLWIIDPLDGTTNFLRGIPKKKKEKFDNTSIRSWWKFELQKGDEDETTDIMMK